MKIGIIGISSLTLNLAGRAAQAGYEVTINNPRGGSLIKEVVKKMGSQARIGTIEQAADSEIVILFIPKEDLESVIKSLPDMSGKIIVHTSGLIFDPHLLLSGITNAMTYKITASLLPKAHIVKLFNPIDIGTKKLTSWKESKENIFFITDHAECKNQIRIFLTKIHYHPFDLTTRFQLQDKRSSLNGFYNPLSLKPFKNNYNQDKSLEEK